MRPDRVTCEVCGELVETAEIMGHLRLFHPDQYGDGSVEDAIDNAYADDEIARITIIRQLTDDDVIDHVAAVDPEGDDLPLTEALGMLRLAEDTLIRDRLGEGE